MMKSISVLLFSLALTANACGQKADNQQKEDSDVVSISEYIEGKSYENYKVATFAGGCFWCTEAAFERIEGVVDVISGYSGGKTDYPTYYQVGGGSTGHAEAIQIYYDAEVVDFATLLEVLFVAHDPTQLNRQGPDVGTEYRSAVFYHGEEQKTTTESVIKKLDASGKFDKSIVTEVSAYDEFWVAEGYHQDYYDHHPENPYVQRISKPKVKKVEKEFADLLKKEYRK